MRRSISRAADEAIALRDEDKYNAIKDSIENPQNYTTNAPNLDSKPAFSSKNYKGAGRDGLTRAENTNYYKIESPNSDDEDTTSMSESTSEPDPAPTPERAEAKERAQNFKADIRGDMGSDFTTDDPNEPISKNKYELNLLQQQVPGS